MSSSGHQPSGKLETKPLRSLSPSKKATHKVFTERVDGPGCMLSKAVSLFSLPRRGSWLEALELVQESSSRDVTQKNQIPPVCHGDSCSMGNSLNRVSQIHFSYMQPRQLSCVLVIILAGLGVWLIRKPKVLSTHDCQHI